MVCPSCGKPVTRGSAACPNCGKPLQAAPDDEPQSHSLIDLERADSAAHACSSYEVLLDGVQIGIIGNNQIQRYEVKPGTHTLRVVVRLPLNSASAEIRISSNLGEVVQLVCGPTNAAFGVAVGYK